MPPKRESVSASSTPRQRRERVREMLLERDLEGIAEWAREDLKVLRMISGLLFDKDEVTCWRAIEALGRGAAVLAETNENKVRTLIRRQLWQMNDESGNVGWRAPEAVGEILYNVPSLVDKFAHILPSYFKEEPFERGAHWAVARVASVRPDVYQELVALIAGSLDDADPHIRVYTVWALRAIGDRDTVSRIEGLAEDPGEVRFYDFETGQFRTTTVGEVVGRER